MMKDSRRNPTKFNSGRDIPHFEDGCETGKPYIFLTEILRHHPEERRL